MSDLTLVTAAAMMMIKTAIVGRILLPLPLMVVLAMAAPPARSCYFGYLSCSSGERL